MKLRIKGDSVRLRLTRAEVRELLSAGHVVDATRFPGGGTLTYELRADAGVTAIGARFAHDALQVVAPAAMLTTWGGSEDVSLEAALAVAGGVLAILIEKDFPCMIDRPLEDDSDAFPRDRLKIDL
jgi:hypothetical protein